MIETIPVNKPISRLYVFVSFDPRDQISFRVIKFPDVEVSARISPPFACFLFTPFQFFLLSF